MDDTHLQGYALFNEGNTQKELRKRVTQKGSQDNERMLLQKSSKRVDQHSLRKTEAIESSIAKVQYANETKSLLV